MNDGTAVGTASIYNALIDSRRFHVHGAATARRAEKQHLDVGAGFRLGREEGVDYSGSGFVRDMARSVLQKSTQRAQYLLV